MSDLRGSSSTLKPWMVTGNTWINFIRQFVQEIVQDEVASWMGMGARKNKQYCKQVSCAPKRGRKRKISKCGGRKAAGKKMRSKARKRSSSSNSSSSNSSSYKRHYNSKKRGGVNGCKAIAYKKGSIKKGRKKTKCAAGHAGGKRNTAKKHPVGKM